MFSSCFPSQRCCPLNPPHSKETTGGGGGRIQSANTKAVPDASHDANSKKGHGPIEYAGAEEKESGSEHNLVVNIERMIGHPTNANTDVIPEKTMRNTSGSPSSLSITSKPAIITDAKAERMVKMQNARLARIFAAQSAQNGALSRSSSVKLTQVLVPDTVEQPSQSEIFVVETLLILMCNQSVVVAARANIIATPSKTLQMIPRRSI
jgi:hypothetical protein